MLKICMAHYLCMTIKAAQVHSDIIKLCVWCVSEYIGANLHVRIQRVCTVCVFLYEFVCLNDTWMHLHLHLGVFVCMHACMFAWPHNKDDKWLKLYLKWGSLSVLMICLASFNTAKFPPLGHFSHINSCYWYLVIQEIMAYLHWLEKKCWYPGLHWLTFWHVCIKLVC